MKSGLRFVFSLMAGIFAFIGVIRNVWAADALQPLKVIQSLNIEKMSSLDELSSAVGKLEPAVVAAMKQERSSFQFQSLVLSKAGNCIDRLAILLENDETGGLKNSAAVLFSSIKQALMPIQSANEKTLQKLDSVRLESIKDPAPYYKSEAWRTPHSLASHCGYWLGWTTYYSSLSFPDDGSEKEKYLQEAIRYFSIALPDLNDDAMIAKALIGRGLCHKETKTFDKALMDFTAAKGNLGQDEELFFKCIYEEAIIYSIEKPVEALHILDSYFDLFRDAKPPETASAKGNRLRANILTVQLEKIKTTPNGEDDATKKADMAALLDRFRKMADETPELGAEFYRYTKSHAAELNKYSYEGLGAWGCAAIGDFLYEGQKYTEAAGYYVHLTASPDSLPQNLMGTIWLRLADIYSKQGKWPEAAELMASFVKKFTEASDMNTAAKLYYAAALNRYQADSNDPTYAKYIEAAKVYVIHCENCPDVSEAHFQLGKHYQKKGQLEKSIIEYSQVGPDSPHFSIAFYPLLEDMVEQLRYLRQQEQGPSEKTMKIYAEGVKRVAELQNLPMEKEGEETLSRSQAAHLKVLQAEFYGYGPKSAAKETLKCLDGFERRYPEEKKLILSAKTLRIEAFYTLGMLKDAQNEISGVMPEGKIDSEQFAFLQDLGSLLHRASISRPDDKGKDISDHQSRTAHKIYEKLYRISVSNPTYHKEEDPLRHRIAEMYMNEDNFDAAREIYEDILKKNPRSASATYNLGAIYEKSGRWAEAFDTWQRFSDRVDIGSYHWFESRYRSAKAAAELGKKDRACEIVKATLSLHPEKGDENIVNQLRVMQLEICNGN